MLRTLTVLLLFQLSGEVIVRALALPIPGPVVGMAMFLTVLLLRGRASSGLKRDTSALLQHLSLLFVPAGAGVMLHLQRIGNEWLPIVTALILSTFAGMAVTALVLRLMTRHAADAEASDA